MPGLTPFLYYLFILPASRLPTPLLYVLSDGLFFVIFSILRYRRRVVDGNLARAFPEKSLAERAEIARDFYRHVADLIVESFKGFTISESEIRRRFRVLNPEVLATHFHSGKSVILAGGHYNNWEWFALGLPLQIRHAAKAIYKPLSNRFLDRKMRATRGRFGLEMVPIRDVPAFFRNAHLGDTPPLPYAMIFGIDQSPGDPRKAHWIEFLNQETGVPFGAEKYAREFDLPVIYAFIRKTARGHYTLGFENVTTRPREMPAGEILADVSRRLEAEIRREPRYWLWSHRRWKHARPRD